MCFIYNYSIIFFIFIFLYVSVLNIIQTWKYYEIYAYCGRYVYFIDIFTHNIKLTVRLNLECLDRCKLVLIKNFISTGTKTKNLYLFIIIIIGACEINQHSSPQCTAQVVSGKIYRVDPQPATTASPKQNTARSDARSSIECAWTERGTLFPWHYYKAHHHNHLMTYHC